MTAGAGTVTADLSAEGGDLAPRVSGRRPLTPTQVRILDFIAATIATRRVAPSFEEIAAEFRYDSLATVHEHLTNLERKGWIVRGHFNARDIRLTVAHCPHCQGLL